MRARGIVAAVILASLTLFLIVLGRPSGAARSATDLRTAVDRIDARQLAAHIRFLSNDLLEGRAPSTRGGALAAEYLAAQLALLGYVPAGDDGTFFQQVPVLEAVTGPDSHLRVGDVSLRLSSDIVAFSGLAEPRIDVSAEIVFVGHGIVAPEYGWDDYAGADVAGKVVLVMVNEPSATPAQPDLFAGDALTYYGRWTYKFEEAARHRALGVLLIHTDASATYPWQVVQSSWGGANYLLPPEPGEPALALEAWVTEDAARRVAEAGGRDLDSLRRAAGVAGAAPVPLAARVSGSLVRQVQLRSSPNVIGVLRGSDPTQGVVVTAHYDHLGVRPSIPGEPEGVDRIFNGALDNASGVAGALEMARVFAQVGEPPRRSIYVMFTTAEESGLLGSTYFASHPALPIEAWAANVNVDELNLFGRARDLVLIGVERSSIRQVADRLARRRGRVIALDPEPGQGNFFRSDHFALAKLGVPAVSVGLPTQFPGPEGEAARRRRDAFGERDYHQTSDEMRDDWSYDGAVDDLRLLAELVWTLADNDI